MHAVAQLRSSPAWLHRGAVSFCADGPVDFQVTARLSREQRQWLAQTRVPLRSLQFLHLNLGSAYLVSEACFLYLVLLSVVCCTPS